MNRYPREARDALIKCIPCNAPVTETVEGKYVCVKCGRSPIVQRRAGNAESAAADD